MFPAKRCVSARQEFVVTKNQVSFLSANDNLIANEMANIANTGAGHDLQETAPRWTRWRTKKCHTVLHQGRWLSLLFGEQFKSNEFASQKNDVAILQGSVLTQSAKNTVELVEGNDSGSSRSSTLNARMTAGQVWVIEVDRSAWVSSQLYVVPVELMLGAIAAVPIDAN